jgi:hypothetical protein
MIFQQNADAEFAKSEGEDKDPNVTTALYLCPSFHKFTTGLC